MKFVKEIIDKKAIQKTDIGINPFLIENNLDRIEKILEFLTSKNKLLLINGFLGTGKSFVLKHALSFLDENVITLKYNCFETTILDDILLEFFENFKKLTSQNIIETPKLLSENFTQKINNYFATIQKPIVIVINSFEQVLIDNKRDILNFLSYLSGFDKIKIIIIGRKFNYEDFGENPENIAITALSKGIFEKYLREEGFKQIGPISDELYKYTRGYYFYTTLAIKIMQIRKLSLANFLSGYTKSFQTFNDFIIREALSLVDPVSGHLFRFLTIMRHPVNVKLLQTLGLYDAERIAFFTDNLILTREGSLIYLQDYFKTISENSIADNIAIKIHKSCAELYSTQLPLKPLERDLLVSRQTMRKEIYFHNLFIPKKPEIKTKIIQAIIPKVPQPLHEQAKQEIKKISFIFESEEDEKNIMSQIANSINRFVDISDRKNQALEDTDNLSLVELINLANKEEQNFDYIKTAMIYQKALTMKNDDDFYTFLPKIYTKLAEAFKNMSDWFNSLKYYELAAEFYLSTGDTEKFSECNFEIANINYISFKKDKAKKILNELLNQNITPTLKTKSILLLSDINGENITQLPENLENVDKKVLAELYFKYALSFDDAGDLDDAVKYYRKCIEISQEIKNKTWIPSALTNLAEIYYEKGNSDLAIKYLQESIRLDEISKNHNGIYISSMKLAGIYASDFEKALNCLKRAKASALELNETFYIASAQAAMGDLYFDKKDYPNAMKLYNDALKLSAGEFSKENTEKLKTRINDIKKVYNEK